MEKQLQEGEVTAMKPYGGQISVKNKREIWMYETSLQLVDFSFPLKKTNPKLHTARFSLGLTFPA